MPIHRLGPNKYRWGNHGKIYPTRAQAVRQAEAAYAHGYRDSDKSKMGRRKKTNRK